MKTYSPFNVTPGMASVQQIDEPDFILRIGVSNMGSKHKGVKIFKLENGDYKIRVK